IAGGEIVTLFGEHFADRVNTPVTLGSMFGALPLDIDSVMPETGNLFARSFRRPELMEFNSVAQLPFFGENHGQLPRQLVDVSVEFDHVFAPVFSVSNDRGHEAVTVQAPPQLRAGTVSVTLHFGKSSDSLDH